MTCERCGAQLGTDGGRYFPGAGYLVQTKREYQHVCVPCETQLMYGPLEARDAVPQSEDQLVAETLGALDVLQLVLYTDEKGK